MPLNHTNIVQTSWKIGPALATGNCVVLKPAELTSLSALRVAELACEAGVPPGVFNVIPGLGSEAGAALALHMDVDMIGFTGSVGVGRSILKAASESNIKRVSLELGGKSPQIIFPDVEDLDEVAAEVMKAAFWNMGENCSCGSRLLVHESIKPALVEKLRALAKSSSWKLGNPLSLDTKIGSMISPVHAEKVLSYIAAGVKEGASLALGGKRVNEESGGHFVEITLFDNVTSDMKIAREEIFGPVLSIITFSTEQEAIALANDTMYGLAASLYTSSLKRAHRVSKKIRAGTVSVNCFGEGDMTTPFGGYKQSGFVGRDKSLHAHEQYTELKTIWMNLE